eukprot:PhM_4_TR9814/c2_g2_i1/m.34971
MALDSDPPFPIHNYHRSSTGGPGFSPSPKPTTLWGPSLVMTFVISAIALLLHSSIRAEMDALTHTTVIANHTASEAKALYDNVLRQNSITIHAMSERCEVLEAARLTPLYASVSRIEKQIEALAGIGSDNSNSNNHVIVHSVKDARSYDDDYDGVLRELQRASSRTSAELLQVTDDLRNLKRLVSDRLYNLQKRNHHEFDDEDTINNDDPPPVERVVPTAQDDDMLPKYTTAASVIIATTTVAVLWRALRSEVRELRKQTDRKLTTIEKHAASALDNSFRAIKHIPDKLHEFGGPMIDTVTETIEKRLQGNIERLVQDNLPTTITTALEQIKILTADIINLKQSVSVNITTLQQDFTTLRTSTTERVTQIVETVQRSTKECLHELKESAKENISEDVQQLRQAHEELVKSVHDSQTA